VEDGFLKYDYHSTVIFSSTVIEVYPIYRIDVYFSYGYTPYAYFEKLPTLGEIIDVIDMKGERDDYVWIVDGVVVDDYNVTVTGLGEGVKAKEKFIAPYINYVDEMGYEVNWQPMGYYCQGASVTVKQLLDLCGYDFIGYTWEIEYKNENGQIERKTVNEDHVVNFVYDYDVEYYGYYAVNLFGKTSAMKIEVSGFIVGNDNLYQEISVAGPISIGEILSTAGINVDIADLMVTVSPKNGDAGYQVFDLQEIVSQSAYISVSDLRDYVKINVKVDGVWQLKTVLLGDMTTVGQVIAFAGYNFKDYYWTITRQSHNLYNITIPVSSENEEVKTYDVIKGQVLENVSVFFYHMDYGWMDGDGTGYVTYSVNDKWDNPTINFNLPYFTLEGWSFENVKINEKAQIIVSIEEIFAKNLAEISLYPVISVNYEQFSGLYYSHDSVYYRLNGDKIVGIEVGDQGYRVLGESSYEVEYEYGTISINAWKNTEYEHKFNFTYDSQHTDFALIMEVHESDGYIYYTVISNFDELKYYISEYYQTMALCDINGNDVTVEELQAGQIYIAYVKYVG
jgi:hypothetical protein